tara:strand:+ start:657 stop:1133 length:477 start_codon:yes stop_codon:yes gene_type:complete
MSLNTVLAAVRTLVATGVGGTVTVHDGVRWARDDVTFRSLMRDATNSRLNAWMVSHGGTDERVFGQNNLNIMEHELICVGLYAVDDPGSGTSMTTELAFRTQLEAVRTQLRQDFTPSTAFNSSPPRTEVFEVRMFHGHLCHYAEVRFEAEERIQYTGS